MNFSRAAWNASFVMKAFVRSDAAASAELEPQLTPEMILYPDVGPALVFS